MLGRWLRALCVTSYWIWRDGYSNCTHFTDEETEAQPGENTCPKWHYQDSNSGLFAPLSPASWSPRNIKFRADPHMVGYKAWERVTESRPPLYHLQWVTFTPLDLPASVSIIWFFSSSQCHWTVWAGWLISFIFFYLFIWLCWVLVVACELLVHSMWNLVPWPGIEPRPLHWEHGVLATGPPGKSPV